GLQPRAGLYLNLVVNGDPDVRKLDQTPLFIALCLREEIALRVPLVALELKEFIDMQPAFGCIGCAGKIARHYIKKRLRRAVVEFENLIKGRSLLIGCRLRSRVAHCNKRPREITIKITAISSLLPAAFIVDDSLQR